MNVLSLFDGMSCGRVALERCGFEINKYYASEIDKYAITVAQNNYLDTIHIGKHYRYITPIECERLQTLPDNYTLGVSNSQRYKMLGNGWTVDAVCEFFKHIPKDLELF